MANGDTNPLASLTPEKQANVAAKLRALRASGKLNPAQMQSTGKFLISLQPKPEQPKKETGLQKANRVAGAFDEAVFGKIAPLTANPWTNVKGSLANPAVLAKGLYQTARHPIETGKSIISGAVGTAKDIMSGDPERMASGAGDIIGTGIQAGLMKAAPELIGKSTKEISQIPTKVAESFRQTGHRLANTLQGTDTATIKYSGGKFLKNPGKVTFDYLQRVSNNMRDHADQTAEIAKTLDKQKQSVIERASRSNVRVDAHSRVDALMAEPMRFIRENPALEPGFQKDFSRLQSTLASRNLSNMGFKEAWQLSKDLDSMSDFVSRNPDRIESLVNSVKHELNASMSERFPDWSNMMRREAEAIDSERASIKEVESQAAGKSPTAAHRDLYSPSTFALRQFPILKKLYSQWQSAPSLTRRMIILRRMADILDPAGKTKPFDLTLRPGGPGAPNVAPPGTPQLPMPGATTPGRAPTAASPPMPSPPPMAPPVSPAAPMQGGATSVGGAASAPAAAKIPAQIQSDISSVSPSPAMQDLMSRANSVARNASTNDLGQFVNVKTGLEPRRLTQGTTTVAVDSPSSGRVIKGIFDSGKLTKVQVGQNTYRSSASIAKVLDTHGITEEQLRSQIGKPAHPSLHGAGEAGTRAAAAERQASSRAKAAAERPQASEATSFGPEVYMEAVDSARDAIIKQYGAQGKTLISAFDKAAKSWSYEKRYEVLEEWIDKLNKKQ